MNEFEYEFRLADGRTLVVSGYIRDAEAELAQQDPATLGEALLSALGLNRAAAPAKGDRIVKPRGRRPAPPPEENPDTWLRRTSEQSLGTKFKRNTRADGDDGD